MITDAVIDRLNKQAPPPMRVSREPDGRTKIVVSDAWWTVLWADADDEDLIDQFEDLASEHTTVEFTYRRP